MLHQLSLPQAQSIVSKHAQSPLTVSEITVLDNIRHAYQTYRCSCYLTPSVSPGSSASTSHHVYLLVLLDRSASSKGGSESSPIDMHGIAHALELIAERSAGSEAHIAFPYYVVDCFSTDVTGLSSTGDTGLSSTDLSSINGALDVLYIEIPLHPSPDRQLISLFDAVHTNTLGEHTNKLGEQNLAAIEMKLGRWMKESVHGVEGEEFGWARAPPPPPPQAPNAVAGSGLAVPGLASIFAALPPDPIPPNSYSWQETFMQLVESVLHDLSDSEVAGIPFEDIQTLLSRTIAFFLFDDVEVPQLTTYALSAHHVLLSVPTSNSQSNPEIAYILPTFAPSLTYADPLLEGVFAESCFPFTLGSSDHLNPGDKEGKRSGYALTPSPAFMAGYGASPIVFKRQRTKRLWYDLYGVLVRLRGVLGEERLASVDRNVQGREELFKEVKRMVDGLRDAPCY